MIIPQYRSTCSIIWKIEMHEPFLLDHGYHCNTTMKSTQITIEQVSAIILICCGTTVMAGGTQE